MAKKIPAGADLVLQLHYTSGKSNTADKPSVALSLLDAPPKKRILTLQMGRDDLRIPPRRTELPGVRIRYSSGGRSPDQLVPPHAYQGQRFRLRHCGTQRLP